MKAWVTALLAAAALIPNAASAQRERFDADAGVQPVDERAEPQPRAERQERAERPERAERQERPERVERPDRGDRPDRIDRGDRGGGARFEVGGDVGVRPDAQEEGPRFDPGDRRRPGFASGTDRPARSERGPGRGDRPRYDDPRRGPDVGEAPGRAIPPGPGVVTGRNRAGVRPGDRGTPWWNRSAFGNGRDRSNHWDTDRYDRRDAWSDDRWGSGAGFAAGRNAGRDADRNWDRSWHSDRRYDWSGYRGQNQRLYRLPRYYAPPDWGYGYRRFSIGITLAQSLRDESYWLDDPYLYRLPEAYGPYRWVRYYDDALLIDIRTGRVVDLVYGIFY